MTASLIRSQSLFAQYLRLPSATNRGLRRRKRHPPSAAAISSLHVTVRKSRNRGGSDHRGALTPRPSGTVHRPTFRLWIPARGGRRMPAESPSARSAQSLHEIRITIVSRAHAQSIIAS